jgi:hypothetical protein
VIEAMHYEVSPFYAAASVKTIDKPRLGFKCAFEPPTLLLVSQNNFLGCSVYMVDLAKHSEYPLGSFKRERTMEKFENYSMQHYRTSRSRKVEFCKHRMIR